jgi:hypothetical protein
MNTEKLEKPFGYNDERIPKKILQHKPKERHGQVTPWKRWNEWVKTQQACLHFTTK